MIMCWKRWSRKCNSLSIKHGRVGAILHHLLKSTITGLQQELPVGGLLSLTIPSILGFEYHIRGDIDVCFAETKCRVLKDTIRKVEEEIFGVMCRNNSALHGWLREMYQSYYLERYDAKYNENGEPRPENGDLNNVVFSTTYQQAPTQPTITQTMASPQTNMNFMSPQYSMLPNAGQSPMWFQSDNNFNQPF